MTNRTIVISCTPQYLPEQSSLADSRFVFAYHIEIHNQGDVPATLLRRHWIITDANNQIREVEGEGVVGEQPRLEPGQLYSYSSGVLLETEVGTMQGRYQMVDDDGELFDAPIEPFLFSLPGIVN